MRRAQSGQDLRDEYPDGAASDYHGTSAEHRSQLPDGTNGDRAGLGQRRVPDVEAVGYRDEPACPSYHVLGKSAVDMLPGHPKRRAEPFRVSLTPVAAPTPTHHVDHDVRARRWT